MTKSVDEKIESIKYRLSMSLAKFRNDNGLTQNQMAELCGIAQAKYSQIENGKHQGMKIDYLIRANLNAKTGFNFIDLDNEGL